MDGWTDGWTVERMDGRIHGRMDGQMKGQADGWMEEQTDGRTDGWNLQYQLLQSHRTGNSIFDITCIAINNCLVPTALLLNFLRLQRAQCRGWLTAPYLVPMVRVYVLNK